METVILKRLYRTMLRIRRVEEKISELYPEQEMRCPVHLCVGQEAVPAGVCANLSERDLILSGHRSHGHYLAKGGNLNAMLAEIYGKASGCSQGKGGSMHLVDLDVGFIAATPIVGGTVPIAVGTALSSALRGESLVTAVFFGDAVVEEGVFCESVNFAVLKRLPVVFVCEDNGYSVNSPLCVRQPMERAIHHIAQGHGMRSFEGDGNDVIEVYRLSREAVEAARKGLGPTFLLFKTYRWLEHCGPYPDTGLGTRTEDEHCRWVAQCPLKRLKEQLIDRESVTMEELEAMDREILKEVAEGMAFAKQSSFPQPDTLLRHVFAD